MMGLDLIRCEAEVGRCTETVGCEQFNYPLRCKKIAFKQAMWRPDSTPKTNDFLSSLNSTMTAMQSKRRHQPLLVDNYFRDVGIVRGSKPT